MTWLASNKAEEHVILYLVFFSPLSKDALVKYYILIFLMTLLDV